jgi:endonuclease/exonuclease/phosphatase family metal-dependent hydrolase
MRGLVGVSLALALGAALLAAGACSGAIESDEQHDEVVARRDWEITQKREGNLRFVTFNVRNYPAEPPPADAAGGGAPAPSTSPETHADATDEAALLAVLEKLDFDVLAVEEIRDPVAFEALLAKLGERTGATYAAAFSKNEVSGNEQQVGIVTRSEVVAITDVREHPEIDVKGTLRSGLSARLVSERDGGIDAGILVLHLASGESAKRAALRAEQAKQAAQVVAELIAESGDPDFVVLGDLNTAREEGEFGALDAAFAEGTGLDRMDSPAGCTAYYVKNKLGVVAPSWIDQVYTASLSELDVDVPPVSGAHCYERSCQAFDSKGPSDSETYWGVSDHCPVYFEITDADRDD